MFSKEVRKKLTALVLAIVMLFMAIPFSQLETKAATEAAITDFIVVDQFGYRPDAQKVAVIRNPKRGPDAEQGLSFTPGIHAGNYHLIDESTTATAYQGAAEHKFADDLHSGDEIWWFDFSSFKTPGRYYVLDVSNNMRSPSFAIAEDVYAEVLKHAVRMFFYQRSGFEKKAEYAGVGWADTASHLRVGQDKQARFFHDQNNAALERDLHGGWYDAGDYNKYTPWTARYIEEMLNIYRERPEIFTDDYNIPESGNGIPDIIDEAKWGMDHLLRLQYDDGSMISVMGLGHGSPPSSASGRTYYGRVNTTSAYGAARAFALGSIVFREWDGAYADRLKIAAEKAWAWAEANPNVYYNNNSTENGSKDLGAGNQEIAVNPDGTLNVNGENTDRSRLENRIFAALYLYEMTGDKAYQKLFEDNYHLFPLTAWSGVMQHYKTSQHLLHFYYLNLPDPNETVVNNIKTRMRTAINRPDDYAGKMGQDGYRSFANDYNWGSNRTISEYGYTFYYWAEHGLMQGTQTPEIFKDAAEDYLHYIHGVNPFGMVYLTNMNEYGATKSLTSIFHDWFCENSARWSKVGVSTYGPAPGYLSGGANQYYRRQDNGGFVAPLNASTPPAKMYIDFNKVWPESSWEITEPAGGYQVAYIRLLSKFVEVKGDIKPVLKGDVNGDGVINAADATMLRRYLAATDKIAFEVVNPTLNAANADMDGDGDITLADLTMLRQNLAE